MWQQRVMLALVIGVLASPATVQANPDLYEQTLKSTVLVFSIQEDGLGTGTGVVIDRAKRLIVTNDHVVRGSQSLAIMFPRYDDDKQVIADRTAYRDLPRLEREGLLTACRVLVRDPQRDLALLEVESLPDDVRQLPFAERAPRPGERIHSIGNPGLSGGFWVYTQGSVRQVYRGRFASETNEIDARVVESDSSVNPGDSGGPVVNDRGELVAIVQSIHVQSDNGLVSRTSIFIEVSEVKSLLRKLVAKKAK